MLNKHRSAILFYGWIGFVTCSSLFSFSGGVGDSWEIPHLDKVVHGVFYLVMVLFGGMHFIKEGVVTVKRRRRIIALVVFAIGFGILMEFLQGILPVDRNPDLWDELANSAGAVLGGLLTVRYRSLSHNLN